MQGALVVDHYTPVAAGGSDNLSNLRTACVECNTGKKDHILPDAPPGIGNR